MCNDEKESVADQGLRMSGLVFYIDIHIHICDGYYTLYTCMLRKEDGVGTEKGRDFCKAREVTGWAWEGFLSYNTHVDSKLIFAAFMIFMYICSCRI